MRILFLTHRLPYPPDKGEKIRAFHELKHLGAQHEVDLFCLADSRSEVESAPALREFCRSVHFHLPTPTSRRIRALRSFVAGRPLSFGYFESSALKRDIAQAIRRNAYDLVFVNCSSMVQHVPQSCPAPLVVDFVDADSNKFAQYAKCSRAPLSWFFALEASRVAAAEREIGTRAALALVVTSYDADTLGGGKWKGPQVRVVSMGVELPEPVEQINPSLSSHEPFVLFLGTMSYRPNADAAEYFATTIFPLVRRRSPQLKFVIAGRDPSASVVKLARLPGVVVTGTVPDAFAYFRAAAVSVAPFRIAQGFQSKIAESLAVGTPVVASPRPASGIGLTEREGLFTAQTPQEFADKVIDLAGNAALRARFRNNAGVVQRQLGWEPRLKALDHALQEITVAQEAAGLARSVVCR